MLVVKRNQLRHIKETIRFSLSRSYYSIDVLIYLSQGFKFYLECKYTVKNRSQDVLPSFHVIMHSRVQLRVIKTSRVPLS